MRPVNLIPPEQRRGAARGTGGARSPVPAYALLGALGAGVLCVSALVLTGNQVNDRSERVAQLKAKQEGVKAVADALRPYGQFASIETARQGQIKQVAEARIDWKRPLDQLAKVIPGNVWLVEVTASAKGGSEEGSTQAADASEATQAPTFKLVGCAYSHRSVARMMVRMRNLDGVTRVRFSKSERSDDASAPATTGTTAPAEGAPGASQDEESCPGGPRIATFNLLIEFGGLGATATTAADGAGLLQGSAAPTAAAQAAVGQASSTTTAPAGAGQ